MINRSSEGTLVFFGAPSRRQRLARRRLAITAAVCGLAIASWIVGALSNVASPARTSTTSYFASE